MSDRKISYLSRNFDDYRSELKSYISKYYPQISNDFDDASIGSWLIDIVAAVSDNLSFHIDRMYNETNVDSAQLTSSVYTLARSNGVRIPGPKASMAEVIFTCYLPTAIDNEGNNVSQQVVPNWSFAPVIKRGTKVSSRSQIFEVMSDINFAEEFNDDGVSNRTIIPQLDANGNTKRYKITKTEVVYAGESKVYSVTIDSVSPFMQYTLPDADVMNVESIIFKETQSTPTMAEFMNENEYVSASDSPTKCETHRFFEVESLVETHRWSDDIVTNKISPDINVGQSIRYLYGYNSINGENIPTYSITKGMWQPITQKFITEFTDEGYLTITFGSGEYAEQSLDTIDGATDFTKRMISRMVRNNFLGKLPKYGWTMYVLYRVGGGAASNVAANTITNIQYLNAEIGKCISSSDDISTATKVRNSITVTNPYPSVSGKDAPSLNEVKQLIKLHNATQNRCVVLKDYVERILQMPPRYGAPFRVCATEENNKVMLYVLGLDNNGKLSAILPDMLVTNMQNYLSMYRSINDDVEIKSGRIINLSFEASIFVDKNYNTSDVISEVMTIIEDYMDISNHQLGEDIYVGDIEKEISKVDGVLNLISLQVFNECDGDKYSATRTTQATVAMTEYTDEEDTDGATDPSVYYTTLEIDLDESDYILNNESDTMFEIKYPDIDIRVRAKTR